MTVSPHKVLVVVLVVALPVAFGWRPTGPDELPPAGAGVPPAADWPDRLARVVARERLARAAAAGRRPLLEAAALFRELNRRPPGTAAPDHPDPDGPPLAIPLDAEEGRLCLQVVQCAYFALRDESHGRAAEAAARLEAEYCAERRACGAVRLPDPASLEPVERLLEHARAWVIEQERRTAGHGPRPKAP
jgi:hypothetical protein